MFLYTPSKGFRMQFDNGLTLSIRFGPNAYSGLARGSKSHIELRHQYGKGDLPGRYRLEWADDAPMERIETVEIAVFRTGEFLGEDRASLKEAGRSGFKSGAWAQMQNDQVAGYIRVNQLGRLIGILSQNNVHIVQGLPEYTLRTLPGYEHIECWSERYRESEVYDTGILVRDGEYGTEIIDLSFLEYQSRVSDEE